MICTFIYYIIKGKKKTKWFLYTPVNSVLGTSNKNSVYLQRQHIDIK